MDSLQVYESTGLDTWAQVSRRTQVIFFTHHNHLVELVEKSSVADAVEICELRALEVA